MTKEMSDEEIVKAAIQQGIDVNVDQNGIERVDSSNLRATQARNVAAQLGNSPFFNRREITNNLRDRERMFGHPVSNKNAMRKDQDFIRELHSPMGRLVNDQAINRIPGVGSANSSDVGSQNLKKSLANRAQKIFNKQKNKKNGNTSDGNSSSSSSSSEQSYNENTKTDLSIGEDVKAIKKRIKIIKISLIGLSVFAFMFVVMLTAQIITGGTALPSAPLVSSTNYGTADFESITSKDNKYHDDEINFYKKLQSFTDEYSSTVNVNYVNALLMSIYYEADYKQTNEELLEATGGLDFARMTEYATEFAKIIEDTNSTDYEINGAIYNALKNNSKVREYYKDVLVNTTLEDVLTRAFEMGEELDAREEVDETVITPEVKVTVTEVKKETGKKETTVKKTLTINEYIADSIYANLSSIQNSEAIKAYTIAYSTNLASQNNKLSIDANTASASNNLCSVKDGCSYDANGNLASGGSSAQNSKNNVFYNGKYYYRKPLDSSSVTSLNNTINTVFGNVLVTSDGTYPTLDINKINGLGDGYQTILKNSYGNLTIKNIGEDSYILDGSYGTEKVLTKVIFYDQNDYGDYNFCGKKKETIKTSGCGTTSMAMIVSTYENNTKYDPVFMMNKARTGGYCGGGISGTSPGFFKKEANAMKYKYVKASKKNTKDLNLVLKHLSQGHLVIAHMGSGHFTSGGHYMILGGVDPSNKKVYVYDPYNKVNSSYRKTGNGWYSFNSIIAKEAWDFYIIWKG